MYEFIRFKHLPVISNYDIDHEVRGYQYYSYVDNDELTPAYLRSFSRAYFAEEPFKEDRILLVIDEAQLIFNSRDWSQKDRKAWLSFFSQHRKYGYRVILVAQFDRMLDRQIRYLLEYEYLHRKLGNFGWKGKIMTLLTFGEIFVCVKRYYPLKAKIGQELFKCRKKIYQLYNSYTAFDDRTSLPLVAPVQPQVSGLAGHAHGLAGLGAPARPGECPQMPLSAPELTQLGWNAIMTDKGDFEMPLDTPLPPKAMAFLDRLRALPLPRPVRALGRRVLNLIIVTQ
jgi:hypothetical protein